MAPLAINPPALDVFGVAALVLNAFVLVALVLNTFVLDTLVLNAFVLNTLGLAATSRCTDCGDGGAVTCAVAGTDTDEFKSRSNSISVH
jgi:hypothetical protein